MKEASVSDVNKTIRFKTKTEGHNTRPRPQVSRLKTKTIGPIATYLLQTVNEIIFYTTIFYNLCTLSTLSSTSHEGVTICISKFN